MIKTRKALSYSAALCDSILTIRSMSIWCLPWFLLTQNGSFSDVGISNEHTTRRAINRGDFNPLTTVQKKPRYLRGHKPKQSKIANANDQYVFEALLMSLELALEVSCDKHQVLQVLIKPATSGLLVLYRTRLNSRRNLRRFLSFYLQ